MSSAIAMSVTSPTISWSAQLKYLHEAGRHLAVAAQTTSAVLEMQYDRLVFDHNLVVTETRRHEICGACGNLLTSGGSNLLKDSFPSGKLRKESARVDTVQPVPGSSGGPVYTCSRCHRKTLQVVHADFTNFKSSPRQRDPMSATRAPLTGFVGATGSNTEAASSSDRKKRAIVRKQGELLTMIARSRRDLSLAGSTGLGLMEFMKS